MKDKICIVTGSNSGIGNETALALSNMDTTVIMAVRNRDQGEKAQSDIIKATGKHNSEVIICDLSSVDSVRNFSKEFMDKYDRLDVLINNAGAVFRKRETTVDGFERTLAVNYLGHFLLTYELLPLLKSSAPSRIINLSSGLHTRGTVDFSDLQSEKKYNGMTVYSNVKLMVTMFTYELARRLEGTGVTANAVLPGFVATNLGSGSLIYKLGYLIVRPMQITPKKGAETSVYLASSDEVESVTGKTFRELKETESSPESYDQQGQKQLWDRTNELLGLK